MTLPKGRIVLKKILFGLIIVFFVMKPILCQTIQDQKIPEPLQPWLEWLKSKNPQLNCPPLHNDFDQRYKNYPSILYLMAEKNRMTFRQEWEVYAKSFIALPGSAEYWPQNVMINNRKGIVIKKNDLPFLYLSAGHYEIKGQIKYQQRPKSVSIPEQTSIIHLWLDKKRILPVNRDAKNSVWFGDDNMIADLEKNSIRLRVYRKIQDNIPIYTTSIINMSVSGENRELLLGRFLLENNLAMEINSQLPVRLEKNGNLRIQAEPGTWTITLKSRQIEHLDSIRMQKLTADWPLEEIWVFEDNPNLRKVNIEGVVNIEPKQTNIPDEWKRYPVYLVKPDDIFQINEKLRGDFSNDPYRFSLNREFYLDFSGKGYTVIDNISGKTLQRMHFTANNQMEPGKITVNDQPQEITMNNDGEKGVELREGFLHMESVSRIPEKSFNMSAGGWKSDFENVRTILYLPPQWDVFHILGVTQISHSWIQKWNLWSLFVLLIIVVSVAKLAHPVWGIFSGVVLLLTYHDSIYIIVFFITIIIFISLLKVLPKIKIAKIMKSILNLIFLGFCIFLVNYSIIQFKMGLFPQLEYESVYQTRGLENMKLKSEYNEAYQPEPQLKQSSPPFVEMELDQSRKGTGLISRKPQMIYDAQANILTGPGKPNWMWNQTEFSFSGPVEKDHTISFLLIPPYIMRILHFVKVILLLLLVFKIFTLSLKNKEKLFKIFLLVKKILIPAKTMIILIFFLWMPVSKRVYADFPPEYLLKEMEKNLLSKPVYFPNSAAMESGILELENDELFLSLIINSLEKVSFPLPVSDQSWEISDISVNNIKTGGIRKTEKNDLLIVLSEGRNIIRINSVLFRSSLQISFPFQVNNLKVYSKTWNISGLKNGTLPNRNLKLLRIKSIDNDKAQKFLLPDPIESLVMVTRRIEIHNEWQIITEIQRIAPRKGAINLRIPLLDGEMVNTKDIINENGFANVIMLEEQMDFSWDSYMDKSNLISLQAVKMKNVVEKWVVDVSSRWHLEVEGLKPIKQSYDGNAMLPVWRPRAGEKLKLKITKLDFVEGQTKTIEKMGLEHGPGVKINKNLLYFTVNSSKGDNYNINFPPNIVLKKVKIDGQEQIFSLEKNNLNIPLRPGTQDIEIEWQGNKNFQFFHRTPEIKLQTPATNTNIKIKIPQNRWILMTGGPLVGPAVLFWPILLTLILFAVILGRSKITFLKTYEWLFFFLGMSTIDQVGGFIFVIWIIFLCYKEQILKKLGKDYYNLIQVLVILLAVISLVSFIILIPKGLLSLPNMYIQGNGSTNTVFNWYQDRHGQEFPIGWMISVPIFVYRIIMLIWSLWLAVSLVRWIKKAWNLFNTGGLWMKNEKKQAKPAK